jgi:hypothetical protein
MRRLYRKIIYSTVIWYKVSLLQNVAAGFSLRLHRLESLCHRGLI